MLSFMFVAIGTPFSKICIDWPKIVSFYILIIFIRKLYVFLLLKK